MKTMTLALVGNPNVGKSTLFNRLTGSRQHTGNWPGKTVAVAEGTYRHGDTVVTVIDLPGTYSLTPCSGEEEVTASYLQEHRGQVTLVLCDATALERTLPLLFETMETASPVMVGVTLLDEADRHGIDVDLEALEALTGVPVVGLGRKRDLGRLKDTIAAVAALPPTRPLHPVLPEEPTERAVYLHKKAMQYAAAVVRRRQPRTPRDVLLSQPLAAYPLMAALLFVVFYLTLWGANVPSQLLSQGFGALGMWLREVLAPLPPWLCSLLLDGVYQTTTWVVAVMLPPMAIFFPLFTLLEEFGYLPRVAFHADRLFQCAGAHGRQSLTMMMGFGCNACGVMGCRIIDTKREQRIAMLTNALVPCNGRFPTLLLLITLFFSGENKVLGAALLVVLVVFACLVTLLVSKLLSKTVLKGEPSHFVLELPPYRPPQVGQVLVRSLLDRTVVVLGRAVTTAAPVGCLLWIFTHFFVGEQSLFAHAANLLEPVGRLLCVDGTVVLSLLLGFPANEIVMPIALMGYTAGTTLLEADPAAAGRILLENGWTQLTAAAMLVLTLFHFPCGTTLLTIYRESRSIRLCALAVALPAAVGILITFVLGLFR